MVLQGGPCGRVGHRRTHFRNTRKATPHPGWPSCVNHHPPRLLWPVERTDCSRCTMSPGNLERRRLRSSRQSEQNCRQCRNTGHISIAHITRETSCLISETATTVPARSGAAIAPTAAVLPGAGRVKRPADVRLAAVLQAVDRVMRGRVAGAQKQTSPVILVKTAAGPVVGEVIRDEVPLRSKTVTRSARSPFVPGTTIRRSPRMSRRKISTVSPAPS
ncbi:hypothetical protein BH09ACT1_BH09ACT1_05850 [soil metagenome]